MSGGRIPTLASHVEARLPSLRNVVLGLVAAAILINVPVTQAGTWLSIGPGNGASTLAVDPEDARQVYVGMGGSGVFKTSDGGRRWLVANIGLANVAVHALGIDPGSPATAYAATDVGLFKTSNGGLSWSATATLPTPVRAVAVGTGTVYAGTAGGLFRSADRGLSWAGVEGIDAYVQAVTIDPTLPTTIYAATPFGVYKSTDGVDFAPASNGINLLFINSFDLLRVDPSDPSTVFAGLTRMLPRFGYASQVIVSHDGGASWSLVPALERGAVDMAITSTVPGIAYAATPAGLYESTDHGASWSRVESAAFGDGVTAVAIAPSAPGTLYAATAAGVFTSTNAGRSWTATGNGLVGGRVNALVLAPTRARTLMIGFDVVLQTADEGAHWSSPRTVIVGRDSCEVPDGRINQLAVSPLRPRTIYAGTTCGVFRSTDGGVRWQAANTGLGVPADPRLLVNALVVDPSQRRTLYAGTMHGVYKTTDGGRHWNALRGDSINALAIDPQRPGTVYAGTDYVVYKSIDGGQTWGSADDGLLGFGPSVLAVDPVNTDTIYAGIERGVFKSIDGGAHWSPATVGLQTNVYSRYFRAFVIDPEDPATVFVATGEGVFQTADGGAGWSPFGEGLAGRDVTAMANDPSNPGKLYVGTSFGGVLVGCYGEGASAAACAVGELLHACGPESIVSSLRPRVAHVRALLRRAAKARTRAARTRWFARAERALGAIEAASTALSHQARMTPALRCRTRRATARGTQPPRRVAALRAHAGDRPRAHPLAVVAEPSRRSTGWRRATRHCRPRPSAANRSRSHLLGAAVL